MNVGVDIVSCRRIQQLIEVHGSRFKSRVFTAAEIEYCDSFRNAVERYAGRWASKEAVAKALGTGMSQGVSWKDIEIIALPCGKPVVRLSGGAAIVARNDGAIDLQVSISHCDGVCVAFAVMVVDSSCDPTQLAAHGLVSATKQYTRMSAIPESIKD